jgi:predicted dehydrogenase
MMVVAGVPLRRPAWFFDVNEYGEGLADVGTHVVDIVQWVAFPDQILNYKTDVHILSGKRWPTVISQSDFQRVTGEPEFPAALAGHIADGKLNYYCNNSVHYTLRGVHVKLDILWNWEEAAKGSGDLYEAAFRGSKARVEVRQAAVPELYVVPNSTAHQAEVFAALRQLVTHYPGVSVEEGAGEARVVIPAKLRVGHEAHFAQVTGKFFEYLRAPQTMPAWEKSAMLMKYYISTKGVEAGF